MHVKCCYNNMMNVYHIIIGYDDIYINNIYISYYNIHNYYNMMFKLTILVKPSSHLFLLALCCDQKSM